MEELVKVLESNANNSISPHVLPLFSGLPKRCVIEVVLKTASALQSSVDKTELSVSGSVCNEFGKKLYDILCELPVKEVI